MKNELEQKNNLVAIGALAIFYFVFLGGEYLFDNMIAHYLSSAKVVVDILKAQPDLPVEQVVKLALKQIK